MSLLLRSVGMEKFLTSLVEGYEFCDDCGEDAIWHLIRWLEANRIRKSLVLIPRLMPRLMHGAWLSTAQKEYIFFSEDALGGHREHIILHELSHVLLAHSTRVELELMADFLATRPRDDRYVTNYLFRYAEHRKQEIKWSKKEFDAELLAHLLASNYLHTSAPLPTAAPFHSFFGSFKLR